MKIKAVSGIMLALLLASILTLAFVIQRLEANPIYPGQVVMTREDIDAIVFNNNSIAQAKVNGTYTFHSYGSYGVTMYYPVPPNATNISVKIDETTLDWEWASDWYETHYHTVIGDYPLIEWSIDDVPLDFTIMTHYEHTVPLIEGKYQFLYALGTGRYLADPKDCEAYIETYIGKDVAPTQSCIEVYLATEDGVLEPATYEITSIDGMWKVIYYVKFWSWSKDFIITITPFEGPVTWTVDDDGPADFTSIQHAIDAASPRDIIYVYKGLYYEHVVVNKTVQLKAFPPREYTFIDGNRTPGTVVTITANDVVVAGFKILNSGSQPEDAGIRLDNSQGTIVGYNTLINNGIGISLVDSDNNTLSGNNIDYCEYCSIDLRNSHNNVIEYNYMRKHGIQLWESNSNALHNNRMFEAEYGISLRGNHNNITGNEFESNTIGINLQGNHNIIIRNIIRSSIQYGILLSSRDNVIYHNNLVNNTRQVWTDSINSWDDGYPSGGNYWSDHPSVDWYSGPNQDVLGSDGIGDTPYVIDEHNRDRYPLMMWPPPIIVVSFYPPTNTAEVGETFTVDITVADIFISETPVCNGLYGWYCRITFNPNIINAVNATEGPFLKSAEHETFWMMEIDNTTGTIDMEAMIYEFPFPPTGAVGSGTLATITFKAVAQGKTNLEFEKTMELFTVITGTEGVQTSVPIRELFPVFIADGIVIVPGSPFIPATLDVAPKTLNLQSKGKWITAHIELPEGYNVSDIDISTVMLNDTISVDPIWVDKPLESVIGDCDDDSIPDLMVKFDRTMVSDFILSNGITYGNVTLTITGEVDGTPFEMEDTIKVLLGGGKEGGGRRRKS